MTVPVPRRSMAGCDDRDELPRAASACLAARLKEIRHEGAPGHQSIHKSANCF